MKFRTKLSLVIIAIVVAAGVVICLFVFASSRRTMHSRIRETLADHAYHTMAEIDRMLFERRADMRIIASDPIICSRSTSPEQLARRLIDYRNAYKSYVSLSFFAPDRTCIADTAGLAVGEKAPPSLYWQQALEAGISAASDIHVSRSLNIPVIYFAVPVYFEGGGLKGVAAARMHLDSLYRITGQITETLEEQQLHIDLVDKTGLLLYSNHNRKAVLSQNRKQAEPVRRSLAGHEQGSGIFRHAGGEQYLYVFVREQGYLDFPGNGWTLVLQVPTRVAFASAAGLRNTVALIFLGVVLVCALVAVIIAHRFSKPLKVLQDAAINIGQGRLDTRVSLAGRDETGALGAAFNDMAQNLQKVTASRDTLDREIEVRKQAEAALQRSLAESRQKQDEIAALLESARAVVAHKEFTPAAQSIFDACKKLIGAAAGYVALLSDTGEENEVLFLDSGGLPCSVDPALPMPIRGLRSEAYRLGMAVYENAFAESPWAGFMPEGHVRLENVLFAPLMIENKARGLIGLANKPGGFTEDDTRRVAAFAELGAIALNNSRFLEKLEDSEARFRSLVEQIRAGIVVHGPDTAIRMVNPAGAAILGFQENELIGKKADDGDWYFITEDGSCLDADDYPVRRAIAARAPVRDCVAGIVGQEASQAVWIMINADPVFDSGGSLSQVIVTFMDITEQRLAEQALQQERQRLYSLLEELPAYVYLRDRNHAIRYANRMFRELFGSPASGRCYELMYDRSDPCPDCPVPAVVDGTEPAQMDRIIRGRIYQMYYFPFTDTDGSTVVMEFGLDVTDQRYAQEQIRAYMRELQRSNEDLEQFAYVASHDLQEPLRAVSGFMQLLQKGYAEAFDERGRTFVSRSVDAAQRMQLMINDLLAYSRITTRGDSFDRCDMNEIMKSALENLSVSIDNKGAAVTCDSLPAVTGDRGQLIRLLQNLIGNAVKFCDDRTPSVHVSAREKGSNLVFSVSDNGIGIEPRYQEKIFNVFERLHGRDAYPGTGIGLAACKKIVNRHGGILWIDSTPGEGSTFYFTIPAVREEQE